MPDKICTFVYHFKNKNMLRNGFIIQVTENVPNAKTMVFKTTEKIYLHICDLECFGGFKRFDVGLYDIVNISKELKFKLTPKTEIEAYIKTIINFF